MKSFSGIASVFVLMVSVIACFYFAPPRADTSQAGLERARFSQRIASLEAELSDFRRAREEEQRVDSLAALELELAAPVSNSASGSQQMVDVELSRLMQLKSAAQAARAANQ